MAEMRFRKMGLGEILDNSFRLYRRNFLRFITILAMVYVPVFLIQYVATRPLLAKASDVQARMEEFRETRDISALEGMPEQQEGVSAGDVAVPLLTALLAVVAVYLGNGMLIRAISDSYLGRQPGIGAILRAVLPRLLTLIVASFLVGLAIGVGLLLLIVPGVIFAIQLSLVSQVVVIEGKGAVKSMGRSRDLVRNEWGKVFLLWLVLLLLLGALNWGFQAIGGALAANVKSFDARFLIAEGIGTIGQILVAPISAGAWAMLYYDMRIRKEAFDLEMLASEMGTTYEGGESAANETAQGAETPPPAPPAQPGETDNSQGQT